jgi:hypothetical protein
MVVFMKYGNTDVRLHKKCEFEKENNGVGNFI